MLALQAFVYGICAPIAISCIPADLAITMIYNYSHTSHQSTDYSHEHAAVVVPVSRGNMLLREGKVDISIDRVDELHVHQQRDADKYPAPRSPPRSVLSPALVAGNRTATIRSSGSRGGGAGGKGVEKGVELPARVAGRGGVKGKEEEGEGEEGRDGVMVAVPRADSDGPENPEPDARDGNELFDSTVSRLDWLLQPCNVYRGCVSRPPPQRDHT